MEAQPAEAEPVAPGVNLEIGEVTTSPVVNKKRKWLWWVVGFSGVALVVILALVGWLVLGESRGDAVLVAGVPVEQTGAISPTAIPTEPSTETTQLADFPEGKYDVMVETATDSSKLADVYLEPVGGGERIWLMQESEVYADHNHVGEYRNGTLFLIRRMNFEGYSDDEWTDELWRYRAGTKGKQLFVGKGIDFRANDQATLVGIRDAEVIVIDGEGGEVLRLSTEELAQGENLATDLIAWNDAGTLLWGKASFSAFPEYLYSITAGSGEVVHYEVPEGGLGGEYQLEPTSGKVAYSDFPVHFDVDAYDEYMESEPIVRLKVWDVVSGTVQEIDTKTAAKFEPEWIDGKLHYMNSSGELVQVEID